MIDIREVGPRDGLQAESPVTVEQRIKFIQQLVGAGVSHIEVASFMRDDRVPSMAGAEEVVAGVPPRSGLTRVGLVANTKGAQRALACGLDEITITVSLSETYSHKNTGIGRLEALKIAGEVVKIIDGKVPTDAVISCSFGSPYDDVSMVDDIGEMVGQLKNAGCDGVTLADTTGVATPRLIRQALAIVGTEIGLHLHETRGTGLLNAIAGLDSGVRRFDSSLGGIGGSPFADGAAGNVATETLVFLLHDMGFETSINLEMLLAVIPLLTEMIGHRPPSALARFHSP